jgi:flagellar hook-associated protein 3 FlgL
MRIPDLSMTQEAIRYMTDSKSTLDRLNKQAASMKTFSNASDNPGAASAALTLRSSVQINQAYLENAQTMDSWMSTTEDAMSNMVSAANEAITLVQKGLNDTLGADERKNDLAVQISGIFDRTVQIGNSSYLDQYIFSGNQVFTKPFTVDTKNTDQVNYNGDNGTIQHDLGPGQPVAVNLNGNQSFSGLFSALASAKDALTKNDMNALGNSLTGLQSALNTVIDYRSLNGARLRQVDTAISQIKNTNSELKSLLSAKEDVNMAEVASLLQNQQITYQAVLEVGQRAISSLNLFDMLK